MDSFIAPNIKVDEVLMENDKAVGIRTGEDEFYANSVIIAEGVNNLLTRQVGLQDDYVPADHVLTGIKEVIKYDDRETLENRFQLNGLSGMSNEFLGYATNGVEGGGFLYTNRDSISLGLVLGLKDLREKGRKPYDILNNFKEHPAIRDIIRGGEVAEYSAHVVSSGDKRIMPKELYKDGVLICGEAANLLMNAGKAIQGMDYAFRSGILAASTIVKAKKVEDFSSDTLKIYRQSLDESFVMKDMNNFQDAVHMLHNPHMFKDIPNLICDFGRKFFTINNEATPKSRKMLMDSIKKHSSYYELLKLGFKASKSL
jgi:electron transfer flavoprotein-quinone oxidoreductase